MLLPNLITYLYLRTNGCIDVNILIMILYDKYYSIVHNLLVMVLLDIILLYYDELWFIIWWYQHDNTTR